MAKQAPKEKSLRVPDRQSKSEFIKAARQVWERNKKGATVKRGRPSLAFSVFLMCNGEAYKMTYGKKSKDKPLSLYKLRQAVEKRPDAVVMRPDPNNKKGPRIKTPISPRTLERHIKAWIYIHRHLSEFFAQRIPQRYRRKLDKPHLEAVEQIRQMVRERIRACETKEVSWDDESEEEKDNQLVQLTFDIDVMESSGFIHLLWSLRPDAKRLRR